MSDFHCLSLNTGKTSYRDKLEQCQLPYKDSFCICHMIWYHYCHNWLIFCRKVFPDIVRLYLEVTVARAIRGAEVNGVALPTYWYQMPRVLAIIRPGRVGRPASRDLFSTFPPSFNMASARDIWKLNENKPIQLYTIYRTTPVSTA